MKLTNNTGIPLALAVWLATDEYAHVADKNYISATSLLKPTKSIVLSANTTEKSGVDISELVQSKMGTALHSSLEAAWTGGKVHKTMELLGYPQELINNLKINPETVKEGDIPIYLERRTNKVIDGWTLSGQFDFVADGAVYDLKSTGTYSYIAQSNKDKYIQQGSIYRWLNPDIITSDVLTILYIFTDWSAAKAKQETDYPKSRLLQQKFPLMSLQETEQFIKTKLQQINAGLASPESLPDCTPEELWMKPSVFKYYKNPEKMDRSTKNFDTYWEANQRMAEDGNVGKIVEVKSEAVFCRYCAASAVCPQAANLVKEGRLIL